MIYYLIGMPGAGKSQTGKELSELTGYPFFDLDKEIEKHAGKSVSDIFTEYGEDYFRDLEFITLQKITEDLPKGIIACGGGTPCFNNTLEWLNNTGETWYLQISVSELTRRLSGENLPERPLFKGARPEDLRNVLTDLLITREKHYLKAWKVISEENATARYLQKYID